MTDFSGFMDPVQNWSKLPNQLIQMLPIITTVSELKVMLYILRHTWGFQEERGKWITLDEFQKGRLRKDDTRIDNGTGLSHQSVITGLTKAIEHGMIIELVNDINLNRVQKFYRLRTAEDVDTPGTIRSRTDQNKVPWSRLKETDRTQILRLFNRECVYCGNRVPSDHWHYEKVHDDLPWSDANVYLVCPSCFLERKGGNYVGEPEITDDNGVRVPFVPGSKLLSPDGVRGQNFRPPGVKTFESGSGKNVGAKETNRKKPPKERNNIYDAVARHVFVFDPVNGINVPKGDTSRCGMIASWLAGKTDKIRRTPVGFISKPAEPEHVKTFTEIYRLLNPGASMVLDPVKFIEHWKRVGTYLAEQNKKPIKPEPTKIDPEESKRLQEENDRLLAELNERLEKVNNGRASRN